MGGSHGEPAGARICISKQLVNRLALIPCLDSMLRGKISHGLIEIVPNMRCPEWQVAQKPEEKPLQDAVPAGKAEKGGKSKKRKKMK